MGPADERISVLRALSDDARLRLTLLVADGGEHDATSLIEQSGQPPGRAYYQLRILTSAGVLRARKVGRERYYRIDPETVGEVAGSITDLARSRGRIVA